MSSAMGKPLHLQDIARLYLGYLNYPNKAIANLVASRSNYGENDFMAILRYERDLEQAKKKYPTPEQFGKYLAHGQWNLDCLSFAIRFTDDDIDKLDESERETFKGENHPSQNDKHHRVWGAMASTVAATESVPWAHRLLLHYHYMRIEPEIIHTLLAAKEGAEPGKWNEEAKDKLKGKILEAQQECNRRGEDYQRPAGLAEYMVRGQMDLRDLIRINSVTREERAMIAHITSESGTARDPFPLDSLPDKIAAIMLADIATGVMPTTRPDLIFH